MWLKFAVQSSGVLVKLGYVGAMLWLYVARPMTLALSLILLAVFALLAVTAQTRR